MKHGPASTSVDAVTTPFSSKMRVMPSFRPSKAWIICSKLYFDIDTRGHVESHQRVHGLGGWLQHVDQSLVGAHLELLPRVLVDERAADHREALDPGGQRDGAGDHRPRALRGLNDLLCRLIQDLVIEGLQSDPDALLRHRYLRILVTAPAPTVRPPSRIANRKPSSMATGVISSISICTLSPGMTISIPSGILIVPVTSVVRM